MHAIYFLHNLYERKSKTRSKKRGNSRANLFALRLKNRLFSILLYKLALKKHYHYNLFPVHYNHSWELKLINAASTWLYARWNIVLWKLNAAPAVQKTYLGVGRHNWRLERQFHSNMLESTEKCLLQSWMDNHRLSSSKEDSICIHYKMPTIIRYIQFLNAWWTKKLAAFSIASGTLCKWTFL